MSVSGSPLGSGALIRLVAAREVSTRLRDKTFLISSAVMLLIILFVLVFQVVLGSGSDDLRIGVTYGSAQLGPAL